MTSLGAKKTITLTFAAIAVTTLIVSLLSSRNIELFSPKILDFSPEEFRETAQSRFFYSIEQELKYSDFVDDQSKSLLQGPVEAVVPSPDGLMAAVVMEGRLLVVDGSGDYLHEVAPVSTYAPDTKPMGKEYFRDQGFQWSPDSKSLYLIRDEYYDSGMAQLFSDKGQLWKFEVDNKLLTEVISPFRTFDYFLGSSGRVYFPLIEDGKNLVFQVFDGGMVKSLGLKNDELVDLRSLFPGESEEVYYTFTKFEYGLFVVRSLGASLVKKDRIESLYLNGVEVFKSSEGQSSKGPYYAARLTDGAFLPGNQYLVVNVSSENYTGQLLVDSETGVYRILPKGTTIYPVMNTSLYSNYRVEASGIKFFVQPTTAIGH